MANRTNRQPFFPGNNREHLTSRYRLRDFDYSTPGYYFLTLPTTNREVVFGRVIGHEMVLSDPGQMLLALIEAPPDRFSSLIIESFVIMPNHVHLLIYITIENQHLTPSDFVKWLKGASTASYRRGVREFGWSDLGSKLWQVGFNDEIVRNDKHLVNVRRYIAENPARWDEDDLY